MSSFRITDDLLFYLNVDYGSQYTRFGYDKALPFAFLNAFSESIIVRLAALNMLISAAFSLAFLSWHKSDSFGKQFLLALVAGLFVYLAQIDIHLVRQQIALYLGLWIITNNLGPNWIRYLGIPVSILFHEIILILYVAWFLAHRVRISHRVTSLVFYSIAALALVRYFQVGSQYLAIVVLITISLGSCRFRPSPELIEPLKTVLLMVMMTTTLAVLFATVPVSVERWSVLSTVLFVWVILSSSQVSVLRTLNVPALPYAFFLSILSFGYGARFFYSV